MTHWTKKVWRESPLAIRLQQIIVEVRSVRAVSRYRAINGKGIMIAVRARKSLCSLHIKRIAAYHEHRSLPSAITHQMRACRAAALPDELEYNEKWWRDARGIRYLLFYHVYSCYLCYLINLKWGPTVASFIMLTGEMKSVRLVHIIWFYWAMLLAVIRASPKMAS